MTQINYRRVSIKLNFITGETRHVLRREFITVSQIGQNVVVFRFIIFLFVTILKRIFRLIKMVNNSVGAKRHNLATVMLCQPSFLSCAASFPLRRPLTYPNETIATRYGWERRHRRAGLPSRNAWDFIQIIFSK